MTPLHVQLLTAPSRRTAGALLFALLLAGCSQDYVSYDDVRVRNTAEELYPITVTEEAVKMSVHSTSATLSSDQVNSIIRFARQAVAHHASSISVLHAAGSHDGRRVAAQAAALLAAQGIQRGAVTMAAYNGTSAEVTLSYDRKVARTKDCGDWSENMAGNQFNELYPNYGCSLQNNFAAMVTNPEDFVTPRDLSPALGASRSAVMNDYLTGEWSQRQQQFPDAAPTQVAP